MDTTFDRLTVALAERYVIEAEIGSGGMATVFRARDLRHGRAVAIKVLHPDLGRSLGAERFLREIDIAARLTHPHILPLHDSGEADGLLYYVMVYVKGESLRARMDREGPLPVDDALRIARGVAGALGYAHEQGIVHRDIKPENILLASGEPLVADFGIAHALTVAGGARLTSTGLAIGTPTYMSPEQISADARLDGRSDLYSLGCVLYEMLAGEAPYHGSSLHVITARKLTEPVPSLGVVRPGVGPALEQVVATTLARNPADRFVSAGAFAAALDRTVSGQVSTLPAASKASPAGVRGWVARFGPLVPWVLAVASVTLWLTQRSPSLSGPALTMLTADAGLTTDPALSPDGQLLAYASDRGGDGDLDIWVHQIGGGEPVRLTRDPAEEREPTFSPDGTTIAFRSEKDGGGIYVVAALGGPARKVASGGRRPRFSPDGSQIAFWTGEIGGGAGFSTRDYCRIYAVPSAGGVPTRVRPDFVGAAYPEWAPDGAHLLFLGNRGESGPVGENIDWWVTPLDGGAPVATGAFAETENAGLSGPLLVYPWALIAPVWAARGDFLVFSARSGDSRNLWRIGISPRDWKVTGPPERMTFSPAAEESPTVAVPAAGPLMVAFASVRESSDIWSLPFDADAGEVTGTLGQLTWDSTDDIHPDLSPDGRRMVWISSRSGSPEIWVRDFETGVDAALTASRVEKYGAKFSPDGTKISFATHRGARWDIHVLPTEGGAVEVVCGDCGQATAWSPDGRYLLGNSVAGKLYLVEVASRKRIDLATPTDRWFSGGSFSPDGRWITFQGSGPWREHIAPFQGEAMAPESTWTTVPSELGGWSPNGVRVYGWSNCDVVTSVGPTPGSGSWCILSQLLDPTTKRPVGPPHVVLRSAAVQGMPAVRERGSVGQSRILLSLDERSANIWMAEWKGR